MGTRSTLHIQDEDKKTIVSVYRQYDGYPSGMGEDIRTALNNGQVELRNGFSGGDEVPKQFNGIQCLGAFLIGALKGVHKNDEGVTTAQIGNIYLTDALDRQEYNYFLFPQNDTVHMRVESGRDVLFNGLLSEFDGRLVGNN